jgi:hypothetical protein
VTKSLKQVPLVTSQAEWATEAITFVPLALRRLSEMVLVLGLPGSGDHVDFTFLLPLPSEVTVEVQFQLPTRPLLQVPVVETHQPSV